MNQVKKLKKFTLFLYFLFAIIFSNICFIGLSLSADKIFNIVDGVISPIKLFIISIIVTMIAKALGGFILGTTTGTYVKKSIATIFYILPTFLLRSLFLVAIVFLPEIRKESFASPLQMIGLPIAILLLTPFVSYYSIHIGREHSEKFNKANSILNINWKHWLWILPFGLVQAVSLPVYFLLVLFKHDAAKGLEGYPSFLDIINIPWIIPRIIILAIIFGIFTLIIKTYEILSETNEKPRWLNVTKVSLYCFILSLIWVILFIVL